LPYGFTDYRAIWDHPNNADLKSKRENPNVLFPGDLLYIPDRKVGQYSRSTDRKHKFVLKRKPLKLRLTLTDQYEKPISNTAFVLSVDSNSYNLTSDGQDKIEQEIPCAAQRAMLPIPNTEETPHKGLSIPIKIGHLEPRREYLGTAGAIGKPGVFFSRHQRTGKR
jgi:N-acetylmuramoyl-L-alanine amidase